MNRFYLFIFLLLTFSSKSQELFFSSPSVFQNLPSIETYQVLQDSKGFIWITTDGGLCRYDGNSVTTFTVKDGISENVILKGHEDKKGRIWFTTLSGYFFYYYNNRFHPIGANEALKKICRSYPINSFFIGENDTLYCSTLSAHALLKIPPQENYKNILRVTNGYEDCNRFCFINKLNNSEAVFGAGGAETAEKNLSNCNGKKILLNYHILNSSNFESSRGGTDSVGNIYFGFGRELIVVRKSTSTVEYYVLPAHIISVYQDKDLDLWIGTSKSGGYLYKHSDLKSKPITFLSGLSISSVSVDREGSIWAATLEKGIFKSNNKEILLFNEKGTYLKKNNDQLTITCTQKKVISVFKNDSIHTDNSFFKFLPPASEFRTSFIDRNYSYFSSDANLYYRVNNDTASFTLLTTYDSRGMFKFNEDTICSISVPKVLILFKNKVIKIIDSPFAIRYSTQLKDKRILIGSRSNEGIFEFKNNAFIPYLNQFPQLKTRINCMIEDSTGNLWIATNEHGLYCYDHNKNLHRYNSLVSNKLNSLTLDSKSNLWATTNGGLIKLDYSKGVQHPSIYIFNQSNGIPNFQLSGLMEFNGKIWCCTSEKLFYFDSEQLTPNKVSPLVYINRILVNDKPLNRIADTLNLPFNENNIRIQSVLIANKNTAQKQFLYTLLGYDKGWHYSTLGDIQYTNLSYGTYTFIIYGLNNDKVKSDRPATFTFTIEKPFWFTWWFILLETTLLAILFYLYFRYWRNKIENREREKTAVNHKISEFKMTALRAQMNPHFIYNAIGSIQHYILKNDIDQSFNYLSKFSMLIRKILNNSRNEYISLSQEISTLQLYIELEQIRFKYPFKFVLKIDEELDTEMDIPTMLIQPYIENSIWHGLMPKETEGLLELLFKKKGDTLLVIIRDNGVGVERGDLTKKYHISKGMSLTEQRIQTLKSTSNKKFVTTVIDLKDENGGSLGTEVNLIIPFEE